MVNRGRGLWLAALGSTILGVPALAQEASPPASDVIGPPALQDFELRPENQAAPVGEPRPTIAPLSPPASSAEQQQQPAASAPVVTIAPPPAPVTNRPAPQRQPGPVEQRATRSTPTPTAEVPAPSEPATDPTAEPLASPIPNEVPVSQPPASATEPLEQAPLEPDDTGGQWWIYLLFAGLVAGLGFVALRRRSQAAPVVAAPVAPAPFRPATPAPAAPPVHEEPARAWIDLEFRPLEAGTTASHATVKFELTVRNTGDGEARDVRIDGRLFNAGPTQDQEIGAYFAEVAAGGMPAPRPLAAKTQMPYRGTVLLPREQVREVTVQGRRLFIPMVAFNVRYRWGETGTGQTSASYLVGSESDPPAEKMGPFRLDLGPRIYRKVGQREHRLRRRI